MKKKVLIILSCVAALALGAVKIELREGYIGG